MNNPGDSILYYGGISPPTLGEYLELLRTEYADNLFVFAGGADSGGRITLVRNQSGGSGTVSALPAHGSAARFIDGVSSNLQK